MSYTNVRYVRKLHAAGFTDAKTNDAAHARYSGSKRPSAISSDGAQAIADGEIVDGVPRIHQQSETPRTFAGSFFEFEDVAGGRISPQISCRFTNPIETSIIGLTSSLILRPHQTESKSRHRFRTANVAIVPPSTPPDRTMSPPFVNTVLKCGGGSLLICGLRPSRA